MEKTLIVITGPTAVGKTALCLDIASHFNIPVINADSRQIYRELKIGTAAPTEQQLRQVRHYFVGILELDDYYSASIYEQQVLELLESQFAHSDYALLSGGSMMYIDAVCNGIDDIPTVDDDTRAMMKRRLAEEGLEALCEELRKLDPEHYAIVDRKNPRRVVHALEICHMTGRTYTSFRTHSRKQRPFRVKKMLPKRHLNALNTVGYKEMFTYLDGIWTLDEAVERMKGNTRRYARKQLTWFRNDLQVKWFAPSDKDQIINYITTND